MGVVVDLASRLRRSRRMRGALNDEEVRALYLATQMVRETEQAMRNQLGILCDRTSTPLQVEEATAALPLLGEILGKRRERLRLLENELFEWCGRS